MSFLTNIFKYGLVRTRTNPDGATVLVGAGGVIDVGGGLSNTVVYRATPACTVTGTTGSNTLSVAAVAIADGRDPIYEIEAGMQFIAADGSPVAYNNVNTATVVSVNTSARTVLLDTPPLSNLTSEVGYFGTSRSMVVPAGVDVIYATYCGGGIGGAGGYTASGGGGGGGGGASRTYIDMPLRVTPGETLYIQVGIGGPGGAKGAQPANNGGNNAYSSVDTVIQGVHPLSTLTSPMLLSGQPVPVAVPNRGPSQKPAAGGATAGGKGGDGSWTRADKTGGPAGGTAGGGFGGHAIQQSLTTTTGGAGGGGTYASATPGDGGSDTLHTDNVTTAEANCGGAGGSSHLGKGGRSGHSTLRDGGTGGDGVGYGSGGGGGASNYAGGNGAPGIVILRW